MTLNFPIFLTLLRVLLIPVFIIVFFLPTQWITQEWINFFVALIFLVAAVTDWFDGYLARKWKQTSRFGAFLDPVADKIMVTVALVLITQSYSVWYVTLPALLMISREVIISALREWMAEIGQRSHVAVSILGKIKTVCQMTALTWLLWQPSYLPFVKDLGLVALYVAVALTLISMVDYLWAAKSHLLNESEH